MFWGRRKSSSDGQHESPSKQALSKPNETATVAAAEAPAEQQVAAASTGLSVFDFGGPVSPGGMVMTGNCTGSDPNQIEACVWRINKVPPRKSTKDPTAKYHIEF